MERMETDADLEQFAAEFFTMATKGDISSGDEDKVLSTELTNASNSTLAIAHGAGSGSSGASSASLSDVD